MPMRSWCVHVQDVTRHCWQGQGYVWWQRLPLAWTISTVNGVVVGDRCPADLTLGIVGVGHVGSLVEHAAADWGFRVLRSDPPREEAEGLGRKEGFVPLAELAAQADVVTFHVPMTKEGRHATAGLGGTDFFAALRDGAVVLNSSRGGIVDEMLWKEAVRNGRCRAVVDTWTGEPSVDRELLERAVFATPHIAGYSVQGKANASAAVISAVARRFGLPLEGWYPEGVRRVERRTIGWDDMRSFMCACFDIETQSQLLISRFGISPGDGSSILAIAKIILAKLKLSTVSL